MVRGPLHGHVAALQPRLLARIQPQHDAALDHGGVVEVLATAHGALVQGRKVDDPADGAARRCGTGPERAAGCGVAGRVPVAEAGASVSVQRGCPVDGVDGHAALAIGRLDALPHFGEDGLLAEGVVCGVDVAQSPKVVVWSVRSHVDDANT
ncbi:hypothetical protein G6O67_006278 [Ophiocordyceps sinensis]|uniref:Uncharacterized protein n=1 Tax=Ophiocordyceps sinensis TaxID=72228 RepID=A0A8H4PKC6_9HYPO|nr:hypothetical protein G6O67_006278 [Ophiocordyceps sinensis]